MSQRYQKGNLTYKNSNPPLNQDLQDVAGFLSEGHKLRWCAPQHVGYFFIIHFLPWR